MPDMGLEVLLKGSNLARLLYGLWIGVEISLLSIAISIPLGILLGILMTRKNRLIRFLTKFYLEFIRIMPQLVLLFLVFFGLLEAWAGICRERWQLSLSLSCGEQRKWVI